WNGNAFETNLLAQVAQWEGATFSTAGIAPVPPIPTITSVLPVSGPTAGGTAVTISGASFTTGASVTFGGSPATGVNVVDATTITAVTPAHAAGAVTLIVTNPDGQSSSPFSAFIYIAPAPPPTFTYVGAGDSVAAGQDIDGQDIGNGTSQFAYPK